MKITVLPGCASCYGIIYAVNVCKLPYALEYTTENKMKEKEFQKKSLFGRVPVVSVPNRVVNGLGPCLKYIASLVPDKKLAGDDEDSQMEVDQWLNYSVVDIKPSMSKLAASISNQQSLCSESDIKITNDFLKRINEYLQLRTYLVGHRLTIADIALYCTILKYVKFIMSKAQAAELPHLIRWYENMPPMTGHKPGYMKLVQFSDEPFLPKVDCQPQKEPAQQKKPTEQQKGEEGGKAPQEKKPAQQQKGNNEAGKGKAQQEKKPPQQQKADEKKPAPQKAEETKAGDPLESLPPTSMNLNNMKFAFMNEKDKKKALEAFWSTFDASGWSFWHLHYIKAEGEGQVLFRTSNLMNGFMQKNDNFRKWAFGVLGVYGEEPNLEICGVWMWRGLDVPKQIKDLDQYEYYKWRKLNHEDKVDRALIEDYWTNLESGTVEGRKPQDAVYFR